MKKHIAHLVRDRALHYGSREVFRYRDQNLLYKSISWKELVESVDLVSKALISLGFGYMDKIGIFSHNKPEWTITDLGILSLRAVVVPFYGTSSAEQAKYIIDETEMQILFVGDQEQLDKALWLLDNCNSLQRVVTFDSTLKAENENVIFWNDFLQLGNDDEFKKDLNDLLDQADSADLATIIYTSGTTGEPKGSLLGHDNFLGAFAIHDDRLDVGDTDISMCFLPLSHVFERTWTYYLLHCGATNVFLENPREVIDELPKVKPSLMCTVPRFFEKTYDGIGAEVEKWSGMKKKIFNWAINIGHQFIEFQKDSKKAPFLLNIKRAVANALVYKKLRMIFGGNLRVVPCAGAAIRPELLRFFHAVGLFVNYGYGATETTATVSCFKPDIFNFDYTGSIMPGIEVKLSESNEILVKGDTVFRGYYNKPEETAKILKDGWYYTGDEGEIIDGEYLWMKDRIKDMFKTSVGKYVSPQKLELLLAQDQLIEQIVAVGDNQKYITALIVPSFDLLIEHMKQFRREFSTNDEMVSDGQVQQIFRDRIDILQKELTPHEKIIKFTLLSEQFSIDNNALTNTLKIRRKIISERYKNEIARMYLSA